MLRKYPFISQEGEKDCGVASLAMIIAYYKGKVPLSTLRELSKTSRLGVTAYHLTMCAEEIGFHAKGIKCEIEDLESKIRIPLIAHVILNQKYQHYIVIYQVYPSKRQLLIADPSEKKVRRISYEQFLEIWDHIVIELSPYKQIPRYYNSISFTKLFGSLISHFKKELMELFLLSIFVTILAILFSFYSQSMVDGLNRYFTHHYYINIFLLFLILVCLKEMTSYVRNRLMIFVSHRLDFLLTTSTFRHLLNLPYHYYRNRTTGEVISRISDLSLVQNFISNLFVTVFVDCSLSLFCLLILAQLNLRLTGISLVIALGYGLLLLLFRPFFTTQIRKGQALKGEVTSHMVEAITSYETIQSLQLERHMSEALETKYYGWTKNQERFENFYNFQSFLKGLLGQVGFLTLVLFGVFAILDGTISLGLLLTYQMLFSYFIEPIRAFIEVDTNFKEVKQALKRILELFYEEKKKTLELPFSFPIIFHHLNYTYSDQKQLLKDVNLTIESEEKVMIVGESGGGKSTLLKLLLQYHTVPRGQIQIGNGDINDYSDKELRKMMTYISQNEMLFTETLYYNLVLDQQVSEEEFMKVVQLCEVDQIVRQEPLGYFMLIEENGFNLSGGEKERIFLARALLRHPLILLIDEGMSQMDISMERRILKKIMAEYPKLTLIMVSHRIDNRDLFSRLIEIDEGVIRKDVRKNDGME